MKLKISSGLRKAVLAAFALLSVTTGSVYAADLTWNGGDGTWSTGGDGWGEGNTFETFDSVTFDAGDGNIEIEITGNVSPTSITISGSDRVTFRGEGTITGATSITKTGRDTFSIYNDGNNISGDFDIDGGIVNIRSTDNTFSGLITIDDANFSINQTGNDFSGNIAVNDGGELYFSIHDALGTGTASIASGGKIIFIGVGYADSTTFASENGSKIRLTHVSNNEALNRNDSFKITGTQLGAGSTLEAITYAEDAAISMGGTVNAASSSDRYTRSGGGYTVDIGEDLTLTDNVRLELNEGTTTIKGGGTYEIHSLVFGFTSDSTDAILNIEAGATLRVLGTTNSDGGSLGAFMLSNYGRTSQTTVHGTLDLASGISDGDGTGSISVKDTGTLIMRQGLTASTKGSTAIDIEGGSLKLYDQGDGTNHAASLGVNIKTGSTIQAASEETYVRTALNFNNAADETYNFASAPTADGAATSNKLSVRQTITLSNATANVNSGTLELGGGNNTFGTVNIAAGATLRTDMAANANMTIGTAQLAQGATINSNNMNVGGVAMTGKDGLAATISGNVAGAKVENATFSNVTVTNLTITGTALGRSVSNLNMDGSSLDNASLSNIQLTATNSVSTLTSVQLTGVTLAQQSGGSFQFDGISTLTDMTMDSAMFSAKDGATVNHVNTKFTDITVTKQATDLTFIPTGMTSSVSAQAWTLGGSTAAILKSATGSLTLDLGTLTGYSELLDGVHAAFEVDGLTLTDISDLYYNNITLMYSANGTDYTQKVLGVVAGSGGNSLIFYIPEPSTATMSLLALAGLLARRRRKTA